MKSLEERKKQRKEQRELLAHGGVIPLPNSEDEQGVVINKQSGDNGDESGGEEKGFFETKSFFEQKEWATEVGRPVPGNIKSSEDVLKYVTGLKEYMDANDGQLPPAF